MIDKLLSNITSDIELLLCHPFIVNLSDAKYKKYDLKLFAEQYYLLSTSFINLLLYGSINIKSDKIRLSLISNLWDEHGNGNIELSHRELLKKFLLAIDTSINIDKIKPLKETKEYIYKMENLCKNASEVEILSILGPACEFFTAKQYILIYEALKYKYSFTDEELVFFTKHIKHDDKHSSDIANSLKTILINSSQLKKSIIASKTAIKLENMFWDGLYKAYSEKDREHHYK